MRGLLWIEFISIECLNGVQWTLEAYLAIIFDTSTDRQSFESHKVESASTNELFSSLKRISCTGYRLLHTTSLFVCAKFLDGSG